MEPLLGEEDLHRLRHADRRRVEARRPIAAATSAPAAQPTSPRSEVSSRNSQSTLRRCMPMARSVPISRVRSRMAMARVFRIPTTITTMRMMTRSPVTTWSAVMNCLNWPIVLVGGGDVELLAGPVLARDGLHELHPVGLRPRDPSPASPAFASVARQPRRHRVGPGRVA